MPPFRNDDEKRQYILDHAPIFKALGIELTKDKIDEIVNDHSKDAQYEAAQKSLEHIKEREEGYTALLDGKLASVGKYGLERMPRAFYRTEDTKEAKAWNEKLKAILHDEKNGAKDFADMSMKALLDFDDDLLTRSAEEIEEYAINHPEEAHFCYVFIDLYKKLGVVYQHQMDDPLEKALVNAVVDKYVYVQAIDSFSGKFKFQADKLSVILPELDMEKATVARQSAIRLKQAKLKELGNANKVVEDAKKALEASPEDAALKKSVEEAEAKVAKIQETIKEVDSHIELTGEVMQYHLMREEHKKAREIAVRLSKEGVLGKEGIYTRAYREVDGKKEYITKNNLIKELVDNGGQDIKYEKVSDADREKMNAFLRTTQKGGAAPMWTDAETRRKYADVAKMLIEGTGRKVSEEDYKKMLTDPVDDIGFNYACDVKEVFKNAGRTFAFSPDVPVNPERLLDGMILNGDSPEIREWNENVSLLAQTKDGFKQMAEIAAKRLLSIDMKALTEMDSTKRIQYLIDHPIDRYMTFIAQNITDAYASTLSSEEKATSPVIQALKERNRLFENIKDEVNIVTAKSSRVASFFPEDLNYDELAALISVGYSSLAALDKSDPVIAEAAKDFQEAREGIIGAKASEPFKRQAEILSSQVAGSGSIYQKPYIIEYKKNEKGETVETKIYGTYFELADKIANFELADKNDKNSKEYSSIQFEERSPEEVEKLKSFMASTPSRVELNVKPEEKKRLVRLRELRTIKENNNKKMEDFIGKKDTDDDLDPELKDLYANARLAIDVKNGSNAVAMAFKYVNEHYDYTKDPIENEKFKVALTTLAMIDGKAAKILVDRINLERGYGGLLTKPRIDLEKILEESGITLGNDPEKLVYDFRNPFDKRVQNVKEIYDHLSNDLDPWYHKNGPEFKAMMQSMRNVLDYATISGGAAPQAVEAMLKDIEEKTAAYAKNADAKLSLGQNRRAAALAMLSTLNPKKGTELLNELKIDKTWVNDVAKKFESNVQDVTTRNFLNSVKLSQSLNKAEIVKRMEDDIKATEAEADAKKAALASLEDNAEAKIDKEVAQKEIADLAAQHMVKKRILESVKSNDINTNDIITEISKVRVYEQGKQIAGDNVYEQVVSNIKINQGQEIDNIIEKIENNYAKDRVEAVKAKQEAEAAKLKEEQEAAAREKHFKEVEKALKEADEAKKRAEAERIEKNKMKYKFTFRATKEMVEDSIKEIVEELKGEAHSDGIKAETFAKYIYNRTRLAHINKIGEQQDSFEADGVLTGQMLFKDENFNAVLHSEAFGKMQPYPTKFDAETLDKAYESFKKSVVQNKEEKFYGILDEPAVAEKAEVKEAEVGGRALH